MSRKIYLLFLTVFTTLSAIAQVGAGTIKGKLTDQSNGEPVPFANVVAKRNGVVVSGGQTDFDGNYVIKPLEPGKYDVEATFVGFSTKRKEGVIVNSDQITYLNLTLSTSIDMNTVVIEGYKEPLIQKDGQSKTTVSREAIQKMPQRDIAGIASTIGGVSTAGTGGGISIRGSRPDGGNFIYIDGIKVRGSNNLPKSALAEVTVIPGGVPANYGDVTGGIISITTRGPSATFSGSVEAVTSGFKTGDKVTGFDPFGYNLVEGYLNGPIWSKVDADGVKKPILGFSASLNYTSRVDGRPSAIGYNQISASERDILVNDLIYKTSSDAIRFSSQDLRTGSFQNVKTSSNTGSQSVSGNFKLDVTTTPTINLTFGGSFNYDDRRNYSFANQFLNSENNSLTHALDWRAYGRFTQRFRSSDESASSIKNVYYTVMVDFSKQMNETMNAQHKKNFWDYGYVGNFKLYKDTAQYAFAEGGYLRQSDLPGDTLVVFTPGDKNPLLARYTTEYFQLFDQTRGNYERIDQILKGGLRNGDAPQTVYGLFNAPGAPAGGYGRTNNNQFRITASGSADIGNHAVSAGFEYEQRSDRFFGYNNLVANENGRNTNLWAISRNLVNAHLTGLDFSDSTITEYDAQGNPLPFPIVTFNTLVGDNQSFFDRNLRIKLGLDPNGTDIINIDEIDPELLSMDFFNSDELINKGNSLVTYYGYDHQGNRLKNKPAFEDFFSAKDEYGNFTNSQGAFEPIYFAGYVMDKFDFNDINFNVGLRVDRFDANQKVLKDKFLFKEAYTAGEIAGEPIANKANYSIPSSIGSDYTVYVDDANKPNSILGYRSGNNFYNASGQVANPKAVKNSSGVIAPYLKNPNTTGRGADLEAGAFKDYEPQVNFMPRIAFSFPISDEAVFTAHYDILTRRPVSNNRLDMNRYLYIRNINSSSTNPINNPALKPEKTIDYEVGFQQVISKSSSLKIQLFYREMRDQIQVYQNVGAYPQDYFTLDNLDFGTVKGMTISYDLRKTGNLTMRVNYTLQFADGTGSGVGGIVNLNATDFSTLRTISPLDFDQRHHINTALDYRFGSGANYNGPVIGETKIFQGVGSNFTVDLGSGTPYSASSDPGNSRLKGGINGSRLPWRFTCDFQLDKDIPITFKKGEGDNAKMGNINVYVLMTNIFNTKNIVGVYRATGNPDDDGYLADARYQTQIDARTNSLSYRDLYALNNATPGFYTAPRSIRVGVRLDF